jgi:Amt family ammonium transporter
LGGLFGAPGGDFHQFLAQFTDVCVNFLFVGGFAFVWFWLSDKIVPLRSKREDEIEGLDIPEMGAEAYPDFQLTDKSSPAVH